MKRMKHRRPQGRALRGSKGTDDLWARAACPVAKARCARPAVVVSSVRGHLVQTVLSGCGGVRCPLGLARALHRGSVVFVASTPWRCYQCQLEAVPAIGRARHGLAGRSTMGGATGLLPPQRPPPPLLPLSRGAERRAGRERAPSARISPRWPAAGRKDGWQREGPRLECRDRAVARFRGRCSVGVSRNPALCLSG